MAPEVVKLQARVIVSDLDRTLTGADLRLDPRVLERIAELREGGVRVVIATGRRLEELVDMGLVDRVDGLVAENGAIVCVPHENVLETREPGFRDAARAALGELASSFHWGRVIGSGPREASREVAARLDAAGVAHALEFNAQEVMILPRGVDKAVGAEACLRRLGLTRDDAWAIGDGENDASLLAWAHVGAAPANAAPAAMRSADVLLGGAYSDAFLELTASMLARRLAP